MSRSHRNRMRMKRASALLAALVAARFAFVFVHFSLVPHFFNPHSGHVEGLRGHLQGHGQSRKSGGAHQQRGHQTHGGVDLSAATRGPRVENHERGVLFHSHRCYFEDFLTERYSHQPVTAGGVAPELLVARGVEGRANVHRDDGLLLLLAPKNSPPFLI